LLRARNFFFISKYSRKRGSESKQLEDNKLKELLDISISIQTTVRNQQLENCQFQPSLRHHLPHIFSYYYGGEEKNMRKVKPCEIFFSFASKKELKNP
jgi:hypothetical protein